MSLPAASVPLVADHPVPWVRRFVLTIGILLRVALVLVIWLGIFQATFLVYLTIPAAAILVFWISYNLFQIVRRSRWPARL